LLGGLRVHFVLRNNASEPGVVRRGNGRATRHCSGCGGWNGQFRDDNGVKVLDFCVSIEFNATAGQQTEGFWLMKGAPKQALNAAYGTSNTDTALLAKPT
jgi:hypothetical protein